MARISARDKAFHDRLRGAHERGVISIYTDFPYLNRPGSPVFNPWESTLPLLLPLLLAVMLLFLGGLLPGLLLMVAAVLLYVFVIRQWLARQLYGRAVVMMMVDAPTLQRLWDFGGVIIAMTDQPRNQARAPRTDWRLFIDRFLPIAEAAEPLAPDIDGNVGDRRSSSTPSDREAV